MSKTIFITGASRGFGKIWTEAFLKRGDKVAATVRDLNVLKDLAKQYGDTLLPIKLDVTNREDCFAAVKKAQEHFGTIDVLINNAGYGLFGTIEETSDEDTRDLIETNFFGLLWVTKAALPVMRQQGNGHIIHHIHLFLIAEAKNLLTGSDQSVSEIGYALDFKNPPYFSRLFKKEVGVSPNEFRFKLSRN